MMILTSLILSFMMIFGQVAVPVGMIEMANTKAYDFTMDLSGSVDEEKFSISMEGSTITSEKIEENYLDATIKVKAPEIDTVAMDILVKDGKFYTTTETLINFYTTTYNVDHASSDYVEIKEETFKDTVSTLNSKYGKHYIELFDTKDLEGEYEVSVEDVETYKEFSEKYLLTLKDFFKDFKPDISYLTSDEKSMSIKIDTDTIYNITLNIVDYLYDNREKVYGLIEKAITDLNETNPEFFELAEITYEELMEELKASKEDIVLGIEELYEEVHSTEEYSYKDSLNEFKGSALTGTVTVDDKSLTGTSNFNLKYEDEQIFDLTSNFSIIPNNNIVKKEITAVTSFEDIEKEIKQIQAKHQPYNRIEIRWTSYNDKALMSNPIFNKANISMNEYRFNEDGRDYPLIGLTDYDQYDYHIIEDRIYLPLRSICEDMGLIVEWDAAAHKAYIIKDGQKIDMTGTIINDRTFIKIRDFEKLGFVIDYTQTEGFEGYFNEATLSTPECAEYFANRDNLYMD